MKKVQKIIRFSLMTLVLSASCVAADSKTSPTNSTLFATSSLSWVDPNMLMSIATSPPKGATPPPINPLQPAMVASRPGFNPFPLKVISGPDIDPPPPLEKNVFDLIELSKKSFPDEPKITSEQINSLWLGAFPILDASVSMAGSLSGGAGGGGCTCSCTGGGGGGGGTKKDDSVSSC